jgi:hypothetical protein
MAELSSQATSIQTIYAMFSEGKLFVNRRYQRKLVWTLEEKQKLIESIQKKYPIPAILIAEREDYPGTYEIIDGLQRLHAIISFIETAFPTLSGARFAIQHFPTAKQVADEGGFSPIASETYLTQREVGDVLNYNLATSYMRGATEAEINDVFDRINTYGHRLSDQERRQAGVQNEFSNMVRSVACTLRGDESADVLSLRKMPSISIDLPMTKHGYEVQANEVFWVEHGVLRATDLRDSMDEQCIADIAACVVGGSLIDRSKVALDEIYTEGSAEEVRISNALTVYGTDKFEDEFKFCVDEILKVCAQGNSVKLRELIFKRSQTNAFPSVFAVIFLAFHELIVKEGLEVADRAGVKRAMEEIAERIDRGRSATAPDERRRNVDAVKGMIRSNFVESKAPAKIYSNHSTVDIDSAIRRSEIELADYELKQGLLTLADDRRVDEALVEKVLKTICAMANNGKGRSGRVLIGITDKDADAERIRKIDGISARAVGRRKVVGVEREAKHLSLNMEQYVAKWRDAIKASSLTPGLRDAVLSSFDYNSYFGLGVLVLTVPGQNELSYFNGKVYWRKGDSTVEAVTAEEIVAIAKRF